MTGCLPDRLLWALSEGDGTDEERQHLAECILCTRRARHLAADVKMIARVLAATPPPARARHRVSVVALALAASIFAVALASLIARAPAVRTASDVAGTPAVARRDGVVRLDTLAAASFAVDDLDDGEADDDPVGAALAAASPCEWDPAGCQDVDQPLF